MFDIMNQLKEQVLKMEKAEYKMEFADCEITSGFNWSQAKKQILKIVNEWGKRGIILTKYPGTELFNDKNIGLFSISIYRSKKRYDVRFNPFIHSDSLSKYTDFSTFDEINFYHTNMFFVYNKITLDDITHEQKQLWNERIVTLDKLEKQYTALRVHLQNMELDIKIVENQLNKIKQDAIFLM